LAVVRDADVQDAPACIQKRADSLKAREQNVVGSVLGIMFPGVRSRAVKVVDKRLLELDGVSFALPELCHKVYECGGARSSISEQTYGAAAATFKSGHEFERPLHK
jgi:hypothetical protein